MLSLAPAQSHPAIFLRHKLLHRQRPCHGKLPLQFERFDVQDFLEHLSKPLLQNTSQGCLGDGELFAAAWHESWRVDLHIAVTHKPDRADCWLDPIGCRYVHGRKLSLAGSVPAASHRQLHAAILGIDFNRASAGKRDRPIWLIRVALQGFVQPATASLLRHFFHVGLCNRATSKSNFRSVSYERLVQTHREHVLGINGRRRREGCNLIGKGFACHHRKT